MAPKNLRAELHHLKTVERPNVIAAIAEARSHGDLSENAEYDAAKERQGFVEGRIQEVESKLANAQIIDPKLLDADGRCVFGATLDLDDQETGARSATRSLAKTKPISRLARFRSTRRSHGR
jgi:transcription elongation factor GreA